MTNSSLKGKDLVSAIFMMAAFMCAVAGVILYFLKGVTIFNPTLSAKVYVPAIIAAVLALVLVQFNLKLGKYAVYLLALYAWIAYLGTQATYIANLFVRIDPVTGLENFVAITVFTTLAWITGLVSAILASDSFGLIFKKGGAK